MHPRKSWGRSPGPVNLWQLLTHLLLSIFLSFLHLQSSLGTLQWPSLPNSLGSFPLPYFSLWVLPDLPPFLLSDPDVPVLNVIPSGSCWVQIWKCGLMGDPELMGSPSHVTLPAALQSGCFSLKEGAEGGGSCFRVRPWVKKRFWQGDLSILWTRFVDVVTRFGHQGRVKRGPFLPYILRMSCPVDARLVCVKSGQALDTLQLAAESEFGPCSWVGPALRAGEVIRHLSSVQQGRSRRRPRKLQRLTRVMQCKHIPDCRLRYVRGVLFWSLILREIQKTGNPEEALENALLLWSERSRGVCLMCLWLRVGGGLPCCWPERRDMDDPRGKTAWQPVTCGDVRAISVQGMPVGPDAHLGIPHSLVSRLLCCLPQNARIYPLQGLSQPWEAMEFSWANYPENYQIHRIILERAFNRPTTNVALGESGSHCCPRSYLSPSGTCWTNRHLPMTVNPGCGENSNWNSAPLSFSHLLILKIKASILQSDYLTNCIVTA